MRKLVKHLILFGVLCGLTWSHSHAVTAGSPTRLVVVVAKGSTLTSISKSELKRIFMGDSVVVDGKKLVPFNAALGTPDRTGFDRTVLGLSGDAVGRFWIDRKVRGQSAAPRALPSHAVIAQVVVTFPGAIAYLPPDALGRGLQTVRVDGLAHTDPNYPITY